jgi:hypothetical protein
MNADLKPVHEYIKAIEKELVAGNATEHTHRPALKSLIEGLAEGVTTTNEPTHIECGAPDFIVTRHSRTIGYLEAKDVDKSLDEAEKSEQLKRRTQLRQMLWRGGQPVKSCPPLPSHLWQF